MWQSRRQRSPALQNILYEGGLCSLSFIPVQISCGTTAHNFGFVNEILGSGHRGGFLIKIVKIRGWGNMGMYGKLKRELCWRPSHQHHHLYYVDTNGGISLSGWVMPAGLHLYFVLYMLNFSKLVVVVRVGHNLGSK